MILTLSRPSVPAQPDPQTQIIPSILETNQVGLIIKLDFFLLISVCEEEKFFFYIYNSKRLLL